MNKEELRENIACPQFGDDHYGKWGALRFEQRKAIYDLLQENKQLKEQLDKYENPEDMTLMYMWCTEKVKDENKQLKERIEELENQLDFIGEQNKYIDRLEKRIDKAIEVIENLDKEDINVWVENKYWVYVLDILKGVK